MPASLARRAWGSGVALGALAALGLAAACSVLNPLDRFESGSGDAGTEAAVDANGAADAGEEACVRSRWPARPTTDDGPGDIAFVNALVAFSAERDRDAGQDSVDGYDLDGVCTCPQPESCKTRAGAPPRCDDPGGVDNFGGELLTTVAALADRKADVNSRLRSGDYGLLFRVRGYNDGANDPQVEVAVFLSNGSEGIEDGGVPPRPQYDGNDRWTVDPKSLAGGTGPPYVPNFVDPNAYVTNHVLVATFDFPMRIGRMTVQLIGSVVTGTLVKDSVGYHIDDGRIAGRVSARQLLTNFAPIADPFVPGGYLCGDASVTYQDAKTQVCLATDIVSDLKQDNTSAPCDALAVNGRFRSSTAQLGLVFGLPPPPTPCGPQWVDDCPK